jgi:hypothetical protein
MTRHSAATRCSPLLGLAFAGLFLASVSRADVLQSAPTQLSNEGRAEGLFHSGVLKFDSGQYAEACVDFAESLKLGPKLGTLLNLALCHETTGKVATAWNEFHHGAAWAAQNNQRDRLEFATQHIRALETRLPRVVLQLPADRAISGIDLDGEPVPEQRWYLPLYLDPGEHKLAVAAPGKKRTTVAFRVTPTVSDQIVRVPSLPDDEAAAPPRAQSTGLYTLGWVFLGVGVTGVATGTVFGILAMTADDVDAANTRATVSTIGFAAGAAFAATGAYLVLTNEPPRPAPPRSAMRPPRERPAKTAGALKVDVAVVPAFGGTQLALKTVF